jgi:hypothetical protein
MPRIRTIKPELPQSETIGRMSRDARLLFIQLFTVSDDAGRARAASRLLASLLYPYDEDAPGLIDGWLGELEGHKAIRRYEVDGSQYLEIVKWLEHQKIDRPSPSRLPEYREVSSPSRETSRAIDADLGPSTCTLDQGPHTTAGAEAQPDERDWFDEFWKEYPKRDGDNPKLPAKMKFDSLVKTGIDPEIIIAGVKRYSVKATEQQHVGTKYVAHALKWLSEQRWADIAAVAFIASSRIAPPGEFIVEGTMEWACWERHLRETTGRGSPVTDSNHNNGFRRGWYRTTKVPSGYDEATGERITPTESEDAA